VATYLFAQSVELQPTATGLADRETETDETTRFLRELEARHVIACADRLKDILPLTERNPSDCPLLTRQESKGAIRGRLDLPRYIANRYRQLSFPRAYPVLVNEHPPQTPENSLVVQALTQLASQLGRIDFPRTTAEGRASLALYNWTRSRLRRWPWSEVTRLDSIEQLQRETHHRIRKRQTGNEQGYQLIAEWVAEWQVDLEHIGGGGIQRVEDGLLAFPTSEFFWNKVFEIWCLREVAASLERCGCTLQSGPLPLHRRSIGPIYRFSHKSADVEVWFQRQRPLGQAVWSYAAGGKGFAGIPDIVLTRSGHRRMVIDAKLRMVTTATRSEETYKMLGYVENFRPVLGKRGFEGLLVFLGDGAACTQLLGPQAGRLTLTVVDCNLAAREITEQHFDTAMSNWLAEST